MSRAITILKDILYVIMIPSVIMFILSSIFITYAIFRPNPKQDRGREEIAMLIIQSNRASDVKSNTSLSKTICEKMSEIESKRNVTSTNVDRIAEAKIAKNLIDNNLALLIQYDSPLGKEIKKQRIAGNLTIKTEIGFTEKFEKIIGILSLVTLIFGGMLMFISILCDNENYNFDNYDE